MYNASKLRIAACGMKFYLRLQHISSHHLHHDVLWTDFVLFSEPVDPGSTQGSHWPRLYSYLSWGMHIEHPRTAYHETCWTEYQQPYRRCNSQTPYVLHLEHSASAPNERVWRITQLAKLSFNHPSVVLTADVFQSVRSFAAQLNLTNNPDRSSLVQLYLGPSMWMDLRALLLLL